MRWPWSRSPNHDAGAALAKLGASVGPGGFEPSAPVAPPSKPSGSDGVSVVGGFVIHGERDRRLEGDQKWITFSNAELNISVVSSAINVWTALGGSAKWSAEPNKRGGKDAQRGADIVTEGLIEAQMSTPWCAVVRKQLMKKFRGFALHEMLVRRRRDGMVVCADLQDRPQWSILRWNKPDEKSAWLGVEQRTHLGGTYYVPRERLFYSVENTLSPSPEGVGLLRQLAEPTRVLELYRRWEGIGFQTDLRGIPIAWAPLAELALQIGANKPESEVNAALQKATKPLTDFISGHNKSPDQGLMLDSATYRSRDAGQSPSGSKAWGFELVQGGASSMPEVGAAIARETRDCARIMNAEWMLLGDVGSGSDAMHADKTAMFGLVANAALDDVGDDATRDCATRLIALNGLDPETCTPRLIHEPIATASIESAARMLTMLFQAGLSPRDPAINVMRRRADLPDAPEVDETSMLLPRDPTLDLASQDQAAPSGDNAGAAGPAAGKPPSESAPGDAGNQNARPDADGGAK